MLQIFALCRTEPVSEPVSSPGRWLGSRRVPRSRPSTDLESFIYLNIFRISGGCKVQAHPCTLPGDGRLPNRIRRRSAK